MKKILLSVQNNLLSEAIQNALVKKGRFCIENVSPNQDGKILDLCIAERVDVLLLCIALFTAPETAFETLFFTA